MDFVFIWRLQRNIYRVVFFVTLPCVSHRAFIEIFVLTRIAWQRYKKKTGHCSFREKKTHTTCFFQVYTTKSHQTGDFLLTALSSFLGEFFYIPVNRFGVKPWRVWWFAQRALWCEFAQEWRCSPLFLLRQWGKWCARVLWWFFHNDFSHPIRP